MTDENIMQLMLTDTCITDFEGINTYPNLENINISESNLNSMDGLSAMKNLCELNLTNIQLNRLSNIENIKGNTEPLVITYMGTNLRYITQSSYDYISDPKNNVKIVLYDQFSGVYATTDDGMEEFMAKSNLEIVDDEWENWDRFLGDGNYYWDLYAV